MRLEPAARPRHGKQHPDRQYRPRRGRAASGLAALAALAFLVGGCGSGATSSSPATTGADAGTGVVTRSGSGGQSGNLTSGGNLTGGGQTSRYSAAFAECMRAHGVPRFPDPNASLPALGSGSGVDPSSPAYQAALHGACKSLAPAGWTSSGLVTQGGRS